MRCRTHVMAPSWCLPLLERMPKSIAPSKCRWVTVGCNWQPVGAENLKAEGYDWALTLPNSLKSALIPLFAGIPRRTGWKGKKAAMACSAIAAPLTSATFR